MHEQADFRNQVRDALRHLHDAARLECHPLVPQLVELQVAGHLTRAQALRNLLKEAVETLRPLEESPTATPGARSYMALRYYYVQGMSLLKTQEELGLSRRQLQRELRRGLDAVASLLWSRRRPGSSPAATGSGDESPDAEILRQELEQWELKREDCTVEALLDETRWMLQRLLDQRAIILQVGTLPAAPVSVDPVLTRQALAKVLQLLAQNATPGAIILEATRRAAVLDLTLRGDTVQVLPADPGWRIPSLLMGHQGGDLRLQEVAGGALEVVLSLPLASKARVLVIDDTEPIHRLFARFLGPHNYEVIGTRSGPEALRLAAELRPDLITLDVMMPSMDGWQVLRDLQSNPATAAIPVVVCSVLNEPELALSLGARGFVKKPVARLDLLAALDAARRLPAPGEAARRGAPAGS